MTENVFSDSMGAFPLLPPVALGSLKRAVPQIAFVELTQ